MLKLLFLSVAVALGLAAPLLAAADSPNPIKPGPPLSGAGDKDTAKAKAGALADKASGQKQAEEKAHDTAKGLGAFGKILPLGQENIDVKIPSFHDGKPSSLVVAGSMTRIDEEHMNMKDMVIQIFGQTDMDSLQVKLITGAYNMTTAVLESDKRSRISRKDFQLEGDSMIFDTHSQQGKMTGHINMVIYDADSLQKRPATPPPANSATAASTNPAPGEK